MGEILTLKNTYGKMKCTFSRKFLVSNKGWITFEKSTSEGRANYEMCFSVGFLKKNVIS
jgi:hypothetical protein